MWTHLIDTVNSMKEVPCNIVQHVHIQHKHMIKVDRHTRHIQNDTSLHDLAVNVIACIMEEGSSCKCQHDLISWCWRLLQSRQSLWLHLAYEYAQQKQERNLSTYIYKQLCKCAPPLWFTKKQFISFSSPYLFCSYGQVPHIWQHQMRVYWLHLCPCSSAYCCFWVNDCKAKPPRNPTSEQYIKQERERKERKKTYNCS